MLGLWHTHGSRRHFGKRGLLPGQAEGKLWASAGPLCVWLTLSLLNLTVCLNDLVLYKNIPVACRRTKNFPEATAARKGYVFRILVCD